MKEEKKYILTKETKTYAGRTLHRIQCITSSLNGIAKDSLGGWIEKEENLSQIGNCWVYDNAIVMDDAFVFGNAKVYGKAVVMDSAIVMDNAKVYGDAIVRDNAQVENEAEVYERATITCNSTVINFARVHGNARTTGYAVVGDSANMSENSILRDNAHLGGTVVCRGFACMTGNTELNGDAVVDSIKDYLTFKNYFSSGRYFSWTRSNNKWCVGCFNGTDKQLIRKAQADSPEKGEYYKAYVDFKNQLLKLDEKYGKPGFLKQK